MSSFTLSTFTVSQSIVSSFSMEPTSSVASFASSSPLLVSSRSNCSDARSSNTISSGLFSTIENVRNATSTFTNLSTDEIVITSCKSSCTNEDSVLTKTQVSTVETTITSCSGGICTTLMSPVTTINAKANTLTTTETSTVETTITTCPGGVCSTLTVPVTTITSEATTTATISCEDNEEDVASTKTELLTMETTITSCSGGICTTLMSPVSSFNSKATTSNNAESTIPKAIKVSCSAGACTTLTTVDAGISMFTRTGLSITQTTVTNCSGGTCTMLTAPIATATSKVISPIPKASSATSIAHSSASYTVSINTNGAYNFDKDNIFGTAIVAVVALLLL
ncbi:unnamed protein product [Saccharomyces cerevisiae]|nr:unnamed protein product [Saccharomyces cerevisiae]